jgi:hypothetical protein
MKISRSNWQVLLLFWESNLTLSLEPSHGTERGAVVQVGAYCEQG